MLGNVLSDSPLFFWIRSHIKVELILVYVKHLHPLLSRATREGVVGLDSLGVVDRAFPVAMVQLDRSDEWEVLRRIELVHDPVLDEHDILAELVVDERNAADNARHGLEDFLITGRIIIGCGWRVHLGFVFRGVQGRMSLRDRHSCGFDCAFLIFQRRQVESIGIDFRVKLSIAKDRLVSLE
jgi:hypothetical protein